MISLEGRRPRVSDQQEFALPQRDRAFRRSAPFDVQCCFALRVARQVSAGGVRGGRARIVPTDQAPGREPRCARMRAVSRVVWPMHTPVNVDGHTKLPEALRMISGLLRRCGNVSSRARSPFE
jgi:hypothetical protein